MKMSVWDPYAIARRMSAIDDNLGLDMFDWDETQLDMYDEDDKVVIKLKAPGFDEKNVDITVENNSVTITGTAETREEEEDKKKKYYRREISQKSFTRTISLPTRVVAEKAAAEFKNGILYLELPKAEEALPKKVNIKVGGSK